MRALTEQDFRLLDLALTVLAKHAKNELVRATSGRKRTVMLIMLRQIASIRAKLVKMEAP